MRERALADEREREMREGRQVSAGADASLLWNLRIEPRIEHRHEQLREVGSRARVALGDDVRAKKHHRAHLALGKQFSDAGGMAAHEIYLQLGEPVDGNRHLGQLTETRRNTVRD